MHPLWQSGRQAAAEAASELCRTLAKFPLGNRAGPQPSGRQEAGPGLVTLSLHPEPEPTNESNFAKTWTFGPPAVLVLHPSWFTCLALKLHFGVSKSEKETSSLRPAADPRPMPAQIQNTEQRNRIYWNFIFSGWWPLRQERRSLTLQKSQDGWRSAAPRAHPAGPVRRHGHVLLQAPVLQTLVPQRRVSSAGRLSFAASFQSKSQLLARKCPRNSPSRRNQPPPPILPREIQERKWESPWNIVATMC